MQQFKDFLKANQIDYTDADIAGVDDWIKESIKSELFTSQFGQLEGLKVRAEWDPQIAKAITFLPEAQALEDHLKSAQKTPPPPAADRHLATDTKAARLNGRPFIGPEYNISGAGDRDRTGDIQLGKLTFCH